MQGWLQTEKARHMRRSQGRSQWLQRQHQGELSFFHDADAAGMKPASCCGGWQPPHVTEEQPVKSELRQPATVPSVNPTREASDCCERIWDRNETCKDWGGRNETIPVYRWSVGKGDPKNQQPTPVELRRFLRGFQGKINSQATKS